MKAKRISLRLFEDHAWGQGNGISCHGVEFCNRGLRDYVNLPDDAKRIDMIFTQDKDCKGDFRFDYAGAVYTVSAYILSQTCREIRRQYEAGYRYFHFEYEA